MAEKKKKTNKRGGSATLISMVRVGNWKDDFDRWKHVGYAETVMVGSGQLVPMGRRIDPRMVPIKKDKIIGICNDHFRKGHFKVIAIGRVTKGTRRSTTFKVLRSFGSKYPEVGAVRHVKNIYVVKPRFNTLLDISNLLDVV